MWYTLDPLVEISLPFLGLQRTWRISPVIKYSVVHKTDVFPERCADKNETHKLEQWLDKDYTLTVLITAVFAHRTNSSWKTTRCHVTITLDGIESFFYQDKNNID